MMFGDAEVKAFEEAGNAGKEADAPDAGPFGLLEERLDE